MIQIKHSLIYPITIQVSPDVRKDDDMDICEYVKFKKIPGGNKRDCEMISGVVFTKNIANKKMASVLSHPKILVLSCAIDYQARHFKMFAFCCSFCLVILCV